MAQGGFDVIIGNPPYIELAKLPQYSGTSVRLRRNPQFVVVSAGHKPALPRLRFADLSLPVELVLDLFEGLRPGQDCFAHCRIDGVDRCLFQCRASLGGQ